MMKLALMCAIRTHLDYHCRSIKSGLNHSADNNDKKFFSIKSSRCAYSVIITLCISLVGSPDEERVLPQLLCV